MTARGKFFAWFFSDDIVLQIFFISPFSLYIDQKLWNNCLQRENWPKIQIEKKDRQGKNVIWKNMRKNFPDDFIIWVFAISSFAFKIYQIPQKCAYHVKIDLKLKWKKMTARGKIINFLMIRFRFLITM